MKAKRLAMNAIALMCGLTAALQCAEAADRKLDVSMWYANSSTPDPDKADVIYFVSTDVLEAKDDDGNESMRSLLTRNDRKLIEQELRFVCDSIFRSDFNFIAPYYHQYTFNCITKYPQRMPETRAEVGKEVCEAFDCYMKCFNNGRPFILAGFSQGAEMVVDILRHMTEQQHSQMVAAYVIGYKVTASDTTLYPAIRPAKGETDTGVTVSYNSVRKLNGIWDFVAGDAAVCINPVSWTTDTEPAVFSYRGTNSVRIDKKHNVLVVEPADPGYYSKWMRENPLYSPLRLKNNLHHWDLLFYTRQIHDNALKRFNQMRSQH